MNSVFEQMKKIRIIPVIKIDDTEKALPLAQALLDGGLGAAEITFRTDAAEESIRRIAQEIPDMCICAGTVLTVEQARCAVEAGAKAIISPGFDEEVVCWCLKQGIPVLPGCATPTQLQVCLRLGLKEVKLFPAEVIGGVKMLESLAGPYAGVRFMPTGGISPTNVKNYLALPNVFCGGGTWMVRGDALKSGDFHKIASLSARFSEKEHRALSILRQKI